MPVPGSGDDEGEDKAEDEGEDDADEVGGNALLSLGEAGKLPHLVLDRLALDSMLLNVPTLDVFDTTEPVSLLSDARLECLFSTFVIPVAAALNSERVGELAGERKLGGVVPADDGGGD